MLEARSLHVNYGGAIAIDGVSIKVAPRQCIGILGANGAGKTSLLRAISGSVKAGGGVSADGLDVSSWPAHRRARWGIAHVPEGRRLIAPMTVRENLMLAAQATKVPARKVSEEIDRVVTLLSGLGDLLDRRSGDLSGGQQQLVAVGRAVVTRPKYLLLDEPSAGLSPSRASAVFDCIENLIANESYGVLLAEQSAALAMELANEICVLSEGRVVQYGAAEEIGKSDVMARYLGVEVVER
jgi:branched-chain amino acid transport system ATP-binding protein